MATSCSFFASQSLGRFGRKRKKKQELVLKDPESLGTTAGRRKVAFRGARLGAGTADFSTER